MARDILDAFCRRHRSQLIYERQGAVQTWILMRENVLQGMRPQPGHAAQLAACDRQLRTVGTSLTEAYTPYPSIKNQSLPPVSTSSLSANLPPGPCQSHRRSHILRPSEQRPPAWTLDPRRPQLTPCATLASEQTMIDFRPLRRFPFSNVLQRLFTRYPPPPLGLAWRQPFAHTIMQDIT
jgi:hypothetical protein